MVLNAEDRSKFIDRLSSVDPQLALDILKDPSNCVRPDQVLPGYDVPNVYFQCGRGYGKSIAAAFRLRCLVDLDYQSIAMIGAAHKDLIQTMIPAFMDMFPEEYKPIYNKVDGVIYLPNGGKCFTFTTEKDVRGGTINAIWWDEVVLSKGGTQPNATYVWYETMRKAFRGKGNSFAKAKLATAQKKQMIITSTPAPWALFRDFNKWCDDPDRPDWIMKRGSAYDNPETSDDIKEWVSRLKGTPLERQEIYGELTSNMVGSLWTDTMIEKSYVTEVPDNFSQIIVALDPATTNNSNSDEFGICVLGLHEKKDEFGNVIKTGYVLKECTGKYDTQDWVNLVRHLCGKYGTNKIVAEKNQGGDMIKQCIDPSNELYDIKLVQAIQDKRARAEPISFLYHQNKIKHYFDQGSDQECQLQRNGMMNLQSELLGWDGKGDSPNRMDAMVHGFRELFYQSNLVKRQPYRSLKNLRA